MAALEIGPADRPIGVIFSHANGFDARLYTSILEPVATLTRILAIDLRGHGRTSLPTVTEGRESWNDLRDDLLAVMTETDVEDVVLAGHSMGATSSLLAAVAGPGRVRSLVLFEPVILEGGEGGLTGDAALAQGALRRKAVFADRAAAIASYEGRPAFKDWTPRMLADYVADGFRDLPDGTIELSCAPAWEYSNYVSQGHDPRQALRDLRRPVRILKAAINSTCRLTPAEAEALGGNRLKMETVPNTTHFLPMERPDVVAGALREAVG
ncbi:MAG TPA: alpha/beta hydrolase [Phenylobacterium sp.]|nr:alpha/beta hydrolase [Phenylobacterium sp.]